MKVSNFVGTVELPDSVETAVTRYLMARESWALTCVKNCFPDSEPKDVAHNFQLLDWPDKEELHLNGCLIGTFNKPEWTIRK